MEATFGIDPSEILHISAKSGKGTNAVLEAIVNRVPPPEGDIRGALTAFLFDSSYDRYRGVISLVNITSGQLCKGDKIVSCHTRKKYEVTEVGIMHPEQQPTGILNAGQVGYIACNMKDSSEAHVGDTLHKMGEPVKALPGFTHSKAMVYAGVFPVESSDFPKLKESIKRLILTDRSITVQRESSAALGQGMRLGFLGTLHLDVFRQRLEDEYEARVIITAPTVPYKGKKTVIYRDRTEFISNPTDFPDLADATFKVVEVQEPVVNASIIVPEEYLGEMMTLCYSCRATDLNHRYLDASSSSSRIILTCRSSGYASFDYEDAGYQRSDLSKLVFLLNSKPVDALAIIVHRSLEQTVGRAWVKKLHKVIPKQLFEVPIQAAVGKRIIARETLSAERADVTAGLYGGHYERKMKHLENQKESKRHMKKLGKVELPQEAFFDILSTKQGR
ncbi:hypothetical protein EW145_g1052 [Phellinidium pouzarii]|uniref:Uncharacterized protein n=1 Tax=Phellinidium pouzarii TaxID=167371 RepID=A0A4S4LFY2_9AGAM|nr:hypothetical protein EW145_g1052 [Phellinidium pouzarii]